MSLREELVQLEQEAKRLEPGSARRAELHAAVEKYAESFLERLPERPAWVPDEEVVQELLETPLEEEPAPIASELQTLKTHVDTHGINPASAGHLGYIPGGGLYAAALGDYLAAVANRYAGVHYASPGAVNIENRLVRWMADLLGYPDTAGGYLASGGSMANLTAVVTAREAAGLKAEQYADAVVYVTEQTHHCVERGLHVAGLTEATLRHIPVGDRFRMRADLLDEQIRLDSQQGLIPWMVVGSAGTTDTGSVDPLSVIADVTERHDLWLHVDAAYGGFFLLTAHGRQQMQGIERSDSAVLNPHKGLFLPYGSGALVVRDVDLLAKAHDYRADYMQDAQSQRTYSPADVSPELSRHFRGLRMWLPLRLHGLRPFRKALKEKLLLARYAWERLGDAGFETGPEPDLSVVLFRYKPDGRDADRFNQNLRELMLQDGRIFLSSTRVNGNYMLRLAILSFRTHLPTIDLAVDLLRENAERLASQPATVLQQEE